MGHDLGKKDASAGGHFKWEARLELARRTFLGGVGASLASASSAARTVRAKKEIRAIAFDAFVLFDSRSIVMTSKMLLGPEGGVFAAAWLQKLFANSWLLTSAGRYQPFEAVAAAALSATAEGRGQELSLQSRAVLLDSFSHLAVWPDVAPALARLRAAGVRASILSNMSEALLASNLQKSGLQSSFDAILSTDRVRCYKPSPLAYAMAPKALGLPAANIGFAAFGGWDAVGATWFGYRTCWVNRSGAPREWLDVSPEIVTSGMEGVLQLASLQGSGSSHS